MRLFYDRISGNASVCLVRGGTHDSCSGSDTLTSVFCIYRLTAAPYDTRPCHSRTRSKLCSPRGSSIRGSLTTTPKGSSLPHSRPLTQLRARRSQTKVPIATASKTGLHRRRSRVGSPIPLLAGRLTVAWALRALSLPAPGASAPTGTGEDLRVGNPLSRRAPASRLRGREPNALRAPIAGPAPRCYDVALGSPAQFPTP